MSRGLAELGVSDASRTGGPVALDTMQVRLHLRLIRVLAVAAATVDVPPARSPTGEAQGPGSHRPVSQWSSAQGTARRLARPCRTPQSERPGGGCGSEPAVRVRPPCRPTGTGRRTPSKPPARSEGWRPGARGTRGRLGLRGRGHGCGHSLGERREPGDGHGTAGLQLQLSEPSRRPSVVRPVLVDPSSNLQRVLARARNSAAGQHP